jgi:hypothetical protein
MLVKKVSNILPINIIQSKRYFLFSLGEISVDIANPGGSWTPTTTLVTVVEKVTDLIDNPSVQMVQNLCQYHLFYAYLCIYFYFFL